MNSEIRQLEPKILWNHFADLNSVPRPSKKEEKVRQFILDFAKNNNLESKTDKVGNVFITKQATKGFENRKTIVLQSHLDMVCQKNNDTIFDFETQGIEMFVESDFVKANGTTLGADNGIGVAAIMSILSSSDIHHPTIEALFTIDEETGMTGALGLEANWLSGEILLNLDTEEDDELDIGCAGGIDVSGEINFNPVILIQPIPAYKIIVSGLQGGHSGIDIHKGFGNANKILGRILYELKDEKILVNEIQSGGLRNAIPREGFAIISVESQYIDAIKSKFDIISKAILNEFSLIEKNISITFSETDIQYSAVNKETQKKIIYVLNALHNGVYRMSPDISDLVEASNNVAKVACKEGKCSIFCLTRSSVESSKLALANALKSVFELAEFTTTFSGEYPGWKPNSDSKILNLMKKKYVELFQSEPKVVACHAGLECGILGRNYPKMDMISFGPNIFGAHSPDEKVQISSVQKFWKYLLEVLISVD